MFIPPKGWLARQQAAKSRSNRVAIDPEVQAQRNRLYAEREALIEAMRDAPTVPSGPVTAAQMLRNSAPVVPDVTPDDDDDAPPVYQLPPEMIEAALGVTPDVDEETAEDLEEIALGASETPAAPEAPEAPEAAPEAPAEPVKAPAPKPAPKAPKASTKKT